jgi:SAM-dependent methyltransferase
LDGRLNADDKQKIRELYESRLAQFGCDVRTVGWKDRHDQWRRFSVLCRGLQLEGKRILDVGCGLGDFVAYLDERGGKRCDYIGVDIAPKLVQEATKRFGGEGRRFLTADLLDGGDIGTFDIVLLSGTLSPRVADNLAMAERMIAMMFKACREVAAVNFLSTYVDYQLPKNFHYRPEVMFAYARSLTRWVSLYHDYPLYEFTLQLFRRPNDDEAPGSANQTTAP